MSKVISGKELSIKLKAEMAEQVKTFPEKYGRVPLFFEVTATEINFAVRETVSEICDAIKNVLEITPPELVRDITDNGIFLCGGVSNMFGMDEIISQETGIKVKIPGEPEDVTALGLLRALTSEDYLEKNGYNFVTLETLF